MFKPTKKQHLVNKAYSDKNGGSGGTEPLIVNLSYTQEGNNEIFTMDKTWKEIKDAFPNVLIHDKSEDSENWHSCTRISVFKDYEEPYSVQDSSLTSYGTDSENGYPTCTNNIK